MMTGLLPLFMLAHFSHHFTAAIFQPLSPFIRDEFSLNYEQFGWMMSGYNIAYGASHLPAGWLSDRLGPRLMIMIGISGVAFFAILAGLAPSYMLMFVFMILLGIMGGGYHPAASPLVAASVNKKYRGSALGLHQIGGTASFFLTPLIAAAIFQVLNWRWTIVSMAIPALIIGIVLFVLLGRRGYAKKATPVTADIQPESGQSSGSVRRLIPFITLGMMIQVLIMGVTAYIALFAVDDLNASEDMGAFLFSLFHFAGFLAGPLGGYLSDRVGTVPMILTASLIAGPALYLLKFASLGWSIWLILLVLGICMYIVMPVTESHIITHSPPHRRATVLGVYYFVSRGGIGLSTPLLGFLADHYGFATSFTVAGAIMLGVAVICSAWVLRNRY
jgi:FSR family fosmidomycin resistance protein-like MFS transporter